MFYIFCLRIYRNREVTELFDLGFGIHNAGMLRSDRTMTERLFADGLLKVWLVLITGFYISYDQ